MRTTAESKVLDVSFVFVPSDQVIVHTEDITERRQAENALRESEERFRTFVELTPAAVAMLDRDLKYLAASRRWISDYRLEQTDIIGRSHSEIFPEVPERWKEIYRRCLAGSVEKCEEDPIPRADGSTDWVQWEIHPWRKQGDEIGGLVIFSEVITERVRVQDALRRSEARYRALTEQIPAVTYTSALDESSSTLYISPQAERILGYPREEWEANPALFRDRLHPGDRERVIDDVRCSRTSGRPFISEYRMLTRNGRVRWFRDEATVVRDHSGKPSFLQGLMLDITERKKAEAVVLEWKNRYEAAIQASGKILYDWDPATNDVTYAGNFQQILGYSHQEMSGGLPRWLELIHPDDRRTFSSELQRVTESHLPFHLEYRVRKADGAYLLAHDDGYFYFDPAGKRLRMVGFVSDITGRKRAEVALRAAEEKYRSIFENAVEGICQTTPGGRFLTANPACARIFGYDAPEDLVGNVTDIQNQLCADPAAWTEFLGVLNECDTASMFETRYRRKDGSMIWVAANARAVRDETGKPAYYEGTLQDITERKRAEEALRLLSGRLLQLQDEERRRFARDLHDSTAQILAGLTLNLTVVSGSAHGLDPKAFKALCDSLSLAEQCSREIRTISYLLHPPLLDEAGLVAALRWYSKGFAERSKIRVDLQVSPGFGRLPLEHETALFRVVQECLTNIHRHSGSPTARIKINSDAHGVSLEVSDQGQGIRPDAMAGDDGAFSTLGVGIAGMRERLRQLGGSLGVDSGRQGTTVRANLPA